MSKGIHKNKNRGELILKDGKKLCPMCELWKDLSSFGKRPDRPIGLRSKCKECMKICRKIDLKSHKFTEYKANAKKRGIEFRLSKEEFNSFWQQPCEYCGDNINTIGLDRIDSNECYNIENIKVCCEICNKMKMALPKEIFIAHCQKVTEHST